MATPEGLIVHTFLSNGLMPFAEVFVRSFQMQHGSEVPILITSVGLNKDQIKQLNSWHSNLEVRNEPLDLNECAKRLETDLETVTRWKSEIEEGVVTNENYHWKILMSVEERYRKLGEIASEFRSKGYKKFLHSDVDMYFRKPLNVMWKILDSSDVAIVFRPEMPERAKVLGAFIGFRLSDKLNDFFTIWNKHIDAFSTPDKPIGYGQTSLYYSYLETRDWLTWCDLASTSGAPFLTKKQENHAEIWIGNNDGGRITKTEAARLFLEDLEKQSSLIVDIKQPDVSQQQKKSPSGQYYRYLLTQKSSDVDAFMFSDNGMAFLAETCQIVQPTKCDGALVVTSSLSNELKNLDFLRQALSLGTIRQAGLLNYEVASKQKQDVVLCVSALEYLPVEDIYWVLDLLFRSAKFCVSLHISNTFNDTHIKNRNILPPQAWRGLLIAVSAYYPEVSYVALCEQNDGSLIKFTREEADNNSNVLGDRILPQIKLGKVPVDKEWL